MRSAIGRVCGDLRGFYTSRWTLPVSAISEGVINNAAHRRFEIDAGGQVAWLSYAVRDLVKRE